MKDDPIKLEDLLRWIETQQQDKILEPCKENDIFDLGQQIADDIKNKNLKNGFIIYDNDNKIRIISIFKDKQKIVPMSKKLIIELVSYLTKLNS
jgi:uncharacterized protein (UPF0303 family)